MGGRGKENLLAKRVKKIARAKNKRGRPRVAKALAVAQGPARGGLPLKRGTLDDLSAVHGVAVQPGDSWLQKYARRVGFAILPQIDTILLLQYTLNI